MGFGLGDIAGAAIGGLAGAFGGDSGEQKQKTEPWGPQADELANIYKEARRIYEGGPQQYYPGQTWVDPNQLELLGRMNQLGFATQQMPGMLGGIYSGFGSLVNPMASPYLESMIDIGQRKIGEGLREQILPSIRADALRAGQFTSSSKDLAKGLAGEAAIQSMEDLNTRLLSDAYNRGLSSQERALSMAPSILGLGMQPGQIQQQIGGMYRGDTEKMLQDYMNRWNFGQQAPRSNLDWYANVVGSPFRGTTTTSAQAPMMSSVLGGAMTGMEVGPKIFNAVSDWFGGGNPVTKAVWT